MKNRLLVIRLGAIGDVLLTGPALRSLREGFKDAEIHFVTKAQHAPLLADNPAVDRVLIFDRAQGLMPLLKAIWQGGYTHVIDWQSNPRSLLMSLAAHASVYRRFNHHRFKRHMLLRFRLNLYGNTVPVPQRFINAVTSLGCRDDRLGLSLALNAVAVQRVAGWLEDQGLTGQRPILALAPGASRFTKRWPVERYQAVARHWAENGYAVVALGGADEKERCEAVARAAGQWGRSAAAVMTLPETAALLSRCRLLISNDTGVMHMACALDVPVAAVFGPTSRELGFYPFRARHRVVEAENLSCRPCSKHGDAQCPRKHFKCMISLDESAVNQAVESLLSDNF